MKPLAAILIAVAIGIASLPALADDAFSYDTLRPGTLFQWNGIEPGRDMKPAGSLSGPIHGGVGGPLGDTEGPGLRAETRDGYGGIGGEDRPGLDCGPGARNLDVVSRERLRQVEPWACPGRF